MKYFILSALFVTSLGAQTPALWDSTKYQKFRSNLIIGFFESYRHFNNHLTMGNDSSRVDYFAESNLISGVEITYDKFSLALALRSTPPDVRKGSTRTFNTNFNFGANRWYWENSLRYFRGFYDNLSAPDSVNSETGQYYTQPTISNVLVKSKIMFFSNYRNFAFRAGYACNYRQLKSSYTWVLSGNINYFDLRNDSALIPADKRKFYGSSAALQGLGSFGVSLNGGAAATLVIWKALFANIFFTVGPDHQWRNYYFPERRLPLFYTSIAGDLRASFGLNFRKCYILWTSQNDFVYYNSSFLRLHNKSLTGTFTMGWRFKAATPQLYKKFQQTDFYRSI